MPDEKKNRLNQKILVPSRRINMTNQNVRSTLRNLRFKLYRDQACNSNMRYSVSRCRLLISPVLTFF